MADGVQGFRVGSVILRGIGVFFRNIVPFTIVSVVAFLPAVAVTMALFGTAVGSAVMGDPAAGQGGVLVLTVVMMLTYFICYFWVLAALTWGVIMDLRGSRPSIGAMLGGSLRALGPVILVGLVVGLMVGLGMLAFIIPGVILICMFWVAVPAALVEQQGVGASLGRSRELTRGRRWSVLAVLLLWALIAAVIQALLNAALGVGPEGDGSSGAMIASSIVSMLMAGIGASINAVGYHDLRVEKEGGGTEDLARQLG